MNVVTHFVYEKYTCTQNCSKILKNAPNCWISIILLLIHQFVMHKSIFISDHH